MQKKADLDAPIRAAIKDILKFNCVRSSSELNGIGYFFRERNGLVLKGTFGRTFWIKPADYFELVDRDSGSRLRWFWQRNRWSRTCHVESHRGTVTIPDHTRRD
jgi:hypothetical protein